MRKTVLCLLAAVLLLAGCAPGAGEKPVPAQDIPAAAVTPAAPADTLPVSAAEPSAGPMDAAGVYAACVGSVVALETPGGGGTGFFVAEDIIATNRHVIADAAWVEAIFADGSRCAATEVLASSDSPDLALLRMDGKAVPLPMNSHGTAEGEAVYTVGSPMGIRHCISDGIVMKADHEDGGVRYILSNFHAIGGNSGGPLLNAWGEVMGVVVGGMSDGPNSIDMVIRAEHLEALEWGEAQTLSTRAEAMAAMARPDEENYERAEIAQAQPGQLVSLGRYEQDGDPENGAEDILWLVLDREGDALTLVSLYCLETLPFHDGPEEASWRDSSLRTWLNGAFADTAFDAAEGARLLETAVFTPDNVLHGTSGGGETRDRVWLMSLEEVMALQGISEPEERFYDGLYAQATVHAAERGVWLEQEGTLRCWWWLRSPGGNPRNAAEVGSLGYLSFNGSDVGTQERAVRPVIRITAE